MREHEVLQHLSGITEIRLQAWVSQGWVRPAQSEAGGVFNDLDVARCELIRQIEDDLAIESETVPVVLSLLDQVYGLRRELRAVMRAIGQQPDSVKREILTNLKQSDVG